MLSERLMQAPLQFRPIYKTVIWGGRAIARFKGEADHGDNVGESWEISDVAGSVSAMADGTTIEELVARFGERLVGRNSPTKDRFPLLVKLIDAADDLSLQVHPNDRLAYELHGLPGKSEAWYVIRRKPGARILCGLNRQVEPEDFHRHIADGTIVDVVTAYGSEPGQFYYVPSGTLHAIGAGNLLVEVQQTSDITYRVYDYDRIGMDGRKRQLHTENALRAIDYTYPAESALSCEGGITTPFFKIRAVDVDDDKIFRGEHDGSTFTILMVVEGDVQVEVGGESYAYVQGETVLLPAAIEAYAVKGRGRVLAITLS